MLPGQSKQLKKAMKEIGKITKRYDIDAAVFLADGLSNGEFRIFHDEPSWSMLTFKPKLDGSVTVHVKLHLKSKKDETNRTVNSIYNIQGMMAEVFKMNEQLCKQIETAVKVEQTKKILTPCLRSLVDVSGKVLKLKKD